MSTVEGEINELKRYFKHHRLVTYAMLGFIVLLTVVFITSNRLLTQQIAYQSNASVNTKTDRCGMIKDCYDVSFTRSDEQIGAGSNIGGACYKWATIICKERSTTLRCKPPFGCHEVWNAGYPGGAARGGCSQWGSCDPNNLSGWEYVASQICGCKNSPPPKAVPPSPTSTPFPTPIPNCGTKCILFPQADICLGGTSCQPVACPKGSKCIPEEGQCWGAMCPFPTMQVGPIIPPGCKLARGTGVNCNKPENRCPIRTDNCEGPDNVGLYYCCSWRNANTSTGQDSGAVNNGSGYPQ